MDNTILLIDGSSFVFRAYHAMPELTAPNGKPTGATRGIINMFKLMQKTYKTKYWGCVFDAPGKTFRDNIHPEYKANRASMPTDLAEQLSDIYGIIKAMGIPVIMQSGIEADDIIGTLAIHAKTAGMKVLIATGDKDFAQLVDDDITLVNTMTNEILDIAGVINKFGVKPSQIIDYLSLVGDKVDNIPGVEKCGPKTAVKWLSEYNTMDNVITNADKITGVVGENLRQAIPWLATAKVLVTIDTNIELDHDNHIADINELICKEPQNDLLHEYYTTLGFKTWLEQLDLAATSANVTSDLLTTNVAKNTTDTIKTALVISKQRVLIGSVEELIKLVNSLISNNLPIALLVIANSYPDSEQIKLVAISTKDSVYIINNETSTSGNDDLFSEAPVQSNYMSALIKLFESNIPKVLPNVKDTLQFFAKLKLSLNNIIGDLTLAHYIRNSKLKHNLATIFNEYLNIEIADLPAMNSKPSKDSLWISSNTDLVIDNCHNLIQYTMELEDRIANEMNEAELNLYRNVELPLAQVLVNIETAGIKLDLGKFKTLNTNLTTNLALLEDKIYQEAKCVFNINSTKQLQDVLFNQLKLPVDGIKKNSNGYSTDEDTLSRLDEQGIIIANYMLEYRTLSKLLNTYVAKLPLWVDSQDRVHTTFDQAFVASGRLSSRDPNLQNIPVKNDWGKLIRQGFIASAGNQLICADYSQIELRVLAHFSGDENLIQAFNQGADIHSITASEIFQKPMDQITKDERRYAKIINFSLLYGKTVFGLSQELKIDRATAKLYIDTYFAKYPKIKACLDSIKNMAHENGFVTTAFGRRIYLPNINASNRIIREAEERLALNAPMQGTSADIIKFAMIQIDKWLTENKLKTKIVLQVHDELILDVPESEIEIIKNNLARLMTETVTLSVKMSVDVKVANNWDEAH